MCIIIFDGRPNTKRVDRVILERSADKNPNGMGIMFPNGQGRLITWRTLDDFDGIWNRYTSARDAGRPVGLHFRYTTKGDNGIENCHPFEIVPNSFAVMHNGTIHKISPYLPKNVSDTAYVVQEFMQKLPPNFLTNDVMYEALRALLSVDRMLFMDGQGRHTIMNATSMGAWWEWKEGDDPGVWFSKGDHKRYILYGEETKKSAVTVYVGGKAHSYDSYDDYRKSPEYKSSYGDWWGNGYNADDEVSTPVALTKSDKGKKKSSGKSDIQHTADEIAALYDTDGGDGDDSVPCTPFFDYGLFSHLEILKSARTGAAVPNTQLWMALENQAVFPIPFMRKKGSTFWTRGTLYYVAMGRTALMKLLWDDLVKRGLSKCFLTFDARVHTGDRRSVVVDAPMFVGDMTAFEKADEDKLLGIVPFGEWDRVANDPLVKVSTDEEETAQIEAELTAQDDAGEPFETQILYVRAGAYIPGQRRMHRCPVCKSHDTETFDEKGDHTLLCYTCDIPSAIELLDETTDERIRSVRQRM